MSRFPNLRVEKLTDEERQQVVAALQASWDFIAMDALKMAKNETMRRSEVFELASDADRPCEHGLSKELYDKFCFISKAEERRIMKEAFPYKLYGM